jgi:adenosylhomocysteine nucleosidase
VEKPPLILFTALEIEARAVLRALGKQSQDVAVRVIGMRGVRTPQVPPESTVIVAGVGGALDPGLKVGDLVLDTPVPGLSNHLPWHVGSIHSSADVVSTPADKELLFRQTQALAVDMEQAAVQRSAAQGVRLIGLRAISDPADMALDPAVLRFVDDFGNPKARRIATALLRRPGLIPHLRLLNKNTKVALGNLGLGVRALVECLGVAPGEPGG